MDDFTSDELEQLMAVFRDQATNILDDMSRDILLLEEDSADPQAMARLRRAAHTIKGDSACIGLESITELSHRLEDIIEAVRDGELSFDTAVVDVLLESLDHIRAAICNPEVQDIDAETLASLLAKVADIETRKRVAGAASAEDHAAEDEEDTADESRLQAIDPDAPPEGSVAFDGFQAVLIRQIVNDGRQVYVVALDEEALEDTRQAITGSGGAVTLVLESPFPGFAGGRPHFVIDSGMSPDSINAWLHEKKIHNGGSAPGARLWWVEATRGNRVVVNPVDPARGLSLGARAALPDKGGKLRRGPEYVRVEAARIDTLLNLAGEMVIARSGMAQVLPDLETAFPKNDLVARFSTASVQMGKLISELQKSVLKMRMVTIDQVFRRFSRPMRELANESGKQVELEIKGGETEMDRTLVDLIYEPLLHLLRNAVDHGLEPSEIREAIGKPRSGKIAMRAYHEGNQVVIEVADDGRGVDVAAVRARAVAEGKLTPAEAAEMTDEQALDLIFAPGISTAAEITRISGRGIGASAVRTAVEELRGSVSVRTELGAGTTFTLRMPLTLAIIKALLFKACGQIFALPLLVVSEVARVKGNEMVYLDNFESFRLRDRFISLVRPARIFGLDRRVGGKGQALRGHVEEVFVIIISIENVKFGIVVDSLIGEQELVIKPLDSEWVQNEALAGASLLGDGRVVLIMDAGAVFRKALRYEHTRERVAVSG
jgi:two-component system chemotaxis sensor kinase CheA